MRHDLVNKYATTTTTGLFLVSTVSGVALFFHFGNSYFHSMHEWLSMVLLVPVAFHLYKNWPAFLGYIKRRTLAVPLALSVLAGLVFAVPAFTGAPSQDPMRAMIGAIQRASIAQAAPLFRAAPEDLSRHLVANGFPVRSLEQSLGEVASAAGRSPRELIAVVAAYKKG